MPRSLKTLAMASLVLFSVFLAACGGGGGDPGNRISGTDPNARLHPTVITSEGRLLNTCSYIPACSGNPYAPFSSWLRAAPGDGATLSGVVRLEVFGIDMANVELLPANGYLPRLGVFNITGDKTVAWLDLDTTRLPNGPLSVRISAFDVPAGQPGAREIVTMPARTWNISNASAPPPTFAAAVVSAPADGSAVSGITRLEIRGSGIANAELLPATGYAPRLGVFNVSADRTVAWLDFDTSTLPDGVRDVRISAYNVQQGQPGAVEIVAMPARRWDFRNGTSSAFTATVTMAPVHGETISGRVRLEVRGNGMKNVELLPASAYLPRLGTFSVDYPGTFAWMELDTAELPNGMLDVRISAFDVAAGQPNAREIIVMPPRQWNVRH